MPQSPSLTHQLAASAECLFELIDHLFSVWVLDYPSPLWGGIKKDSLRLEGLSGNLYEEVNSPFARTRMIRFLEIPPTKPQLRDGFLG